ncbi:hypothetical protein FRC00_009700 [Tulasnella sp. 408]|nr:hypothetical protein FRC00_009700 [Tulasnella sp. 408]
MSTAQRVAPSVATNKTTTMMYKMLTYELFARQAGMPCRQVFVTQSPALAEKVKAYYDTLKQGSLDLDQEGEQQAIPDFTLDDMNVQMRKDNTEFPASWSKLSATCSRKILASGMNLNTHHPLLLFNEIIGVIRGSEAALATECGFLDRLSYLSIGATSQKIFAERREVVYDLFNRYLRFKPKGSWDSAERTHALMHALNKKYGSRPPGPPLDFVYVDEVQDNLLLDTAREQELNLHDTRSVKTNKSRVENGTQWTRLPAPNLFSSWNVGKKLPSAVLSLATPTLRYLSVLIKIQFMWVTFAPVIIVRDEAACKRLREKMDPRHASMVMTIYSSKGQEFNDVLLYDFFADSQASSDDWGALFDACSSNRGVNLEMFERRHAILQIELKSFYVGLTRARERVWVWDSSDRGYAFQCLMKQEKLVEVAQPDECPPPMGVLSTKRQWALRGKECFQREDYLNASLAFGRADLPWWKAVADGFEQRRIAESTPVRDPSRLRSLKSAGDQISSCANHASTANDRAKLLEISADCYLAANAHKLAAEQLEKLQRYEEAAWNYRLAGSFRKAISVVQEHHKEIDPKLVGDIKDVAAVVFSREGETEMAKSLFETPEAHVEFLEENGFCEQRVAVLVDLARHDAAAEALLQQGRRSEAVTCFLESHNKNAQDRAIECLIDGLFQQVTFAMDLRDRSNEFSKLVELTSRVQGTALQSLEIDAVKAIRSRDLPQLRQYGEQYAEAHPHISLLCLDTYLASTSKQPFGQDARKIGNVIDTLRTYVLYGRLIRTVAQFPDLVCRNSLQKIFGLSTESSSTSKDSTSAPTGIIVLPHSFIHPQSANELTSGRGVKTDLGILLPFDTASQQLVSAAKIWFEDLYRVMGRKGSYFLTNAIGCAMFSSAFDYSNAIHYIPRAGWANARSKSDYHLHMEKSLTWFLRNAQNRHYYGVTFIQRAVANKFRMDISTLISFAEEVIGHLIYNAFRLLSANEERETILPKSWVGTVTLYQSNVLMRVPHHVSFTEARTWDEAMRALTGFAEQASSDPLLRIARKVKPGQNNWASGLRILQWTSDKDLLLDLNFLGSGLARSSLKNQTPHITDSSLQSAGRGLNMPIERSSMKEIGDLLPVQPTHEEAHAAEKIFQCYRRYRRRLGGGLGGPLWEAYNDRANLLAHTPVSRLYKIHLRASMPQVLAYVRHIISRTESVHHEINKRVSSVPYEQLDEVRAQAKVVRQVIRDAKAVAARIGPDSSFHDMTSLAFLKGEVKQIVALREKAMEFCPSLGKTDTNYQEGVDFLVPPNSEPKSKSGKLPLLNTDDVFYWPNGELA